MQYVDYVRRYTAMDGMTLEEVVTRAVGECIDRGILADFLRKNKAEAISVSIFEYNEAEEKEKLRKAEYAGGYEAGVAAGREQGIEQGREQGIQALIADNLEEGFSSQRIIEKLEKRFGLTIEEARNYFEKYKN